MTTATATPAPTLTNAGTTPKTPRKLFVNIPVGDLQRSIEFFEGLGFTFDPQFTDPTATCMLVGTDAYFMLLTREKFAAFTKRPTGDAHRETNALYALGVDSREEVDAMVNKAVAAGGKHGRGLAGPRLHVRLELLRPRRAPLGGVLDGSQGPPGLKRGGRNR